MPSWSDIYKQLKGEPKSNAGILTPYGAPADYAWITGTEDQIREGAAKAAAANATPTSDPNTFTLGGDANVGGVSNSFLEEQARLAQMQARGTPTVTPDWTAYNQYDKQQQVAREGMLGLQRDLAARAAGTAGPSVAEMQYRDGLNQQRDALASRAASVHGDAGMRALGRRGAANMTGMGEIAGDAQGRLLRVQDQTMARDAMAGVANSARANDIAAQGAEIDRGKVDATTALGNEQRGDRWNLGIEDIRQGNNRLQQNASASGDELGAEIANRNAKIAAMEKKRSNAEDADFWNKALGIGSAAATYLPMLVSDERAKTDIKDADDMLDGLSPKSYRYAGGDDRHVGVMAQDMERSQLGSSAVRELPGGLKGIDVRDGLSAALAGMAALNQRVRKLEK